MKAKFNNDDLKQAAPLAIMLIAAFAVWWIYGPSALIIAIIGVFVLHGLIEKSFRQREEEARAAAYANCVAPLLVFSTTPTEPPEEAHARAAHIREQLSISGNPYANDLPVVVYAFSVYMGAGNPVIMPQAPGISWAYYQYMCGVKTGEVFADWITRGQKVLSPADYQTFLTGVLPTPQTATP